jgi:GTP pyrophosphokinase
MGVASIVADYGGTQEQIIAALLHDTVEDCGGLPRLEDIRETFGERVSTIVAACTDSFAEVKDEKLEWRARKEAHLAHLRTFLTPETAVVIAADKLHNLRAIRRDLRTEGPKVWERFKGGEKGTMWYYAEMISILSEIGRPRFFENTDVHDVSNVWALASELEHTWERFPLDMRERGR